MTEHMTELDIAEAMRDGDERPVHLPTGSLFAIRITGTGAAYRMALEEYTWRDPSLYLNDRFLQRCNGLFVIFEHPEVGMLNSNEFANRIVGAIVLAYIKGDEVWGIARICDKDTIELLENGKIASTSPGVSFSPVSDSRKIEIDGGNTLLIEGNPTFLDHIALCESGVWDKLGEPTGVISTITGEQSMADETTEDKKDAMPAWAADTFGKMMEHLDSMGKRMDAMEAKPAPDPEPAKDSADAEVEAKAAKAKADQEEKDAQKARLDAVEQAVKDSVPAERSDAEAAEMADAQARCDSVATAFGKQARPPQPGESVIAYRRRLVSDYKVHSPSWKDVDLGALPAEALRIAEPAIYADAQIAARRPDAVAPGTLREVKERTEAGHMVTKFYGDVDVTLAPFTPPFIQRSRIIPPAKGLN